MSDELVALGASLLAAGLLARAGRRLRIPTIPLFMLAGLAFGPHTPGVELVRDPADLELLATLGLVFLLFYLGLEFSTRDLIDGGRRLLLSAGVFVAINMSAGLAFGFALGWGSEEALIVAGAIGISSSAIATKLVVELRRLGNPETRVILGIIVVEDLFLAGYLAFLQPVLNDTHGALDTVMSIAGAFAFLVVLTVIARTGGRFVAQFVNVADDELLTVSFVGLTVLIAGVALELGVSDAIGAFMAGLVLAESPARKRIQTLVLPLRDTFAALFFFSVGLALDPGDVAAVALPILLAVTISLFANVGAGFVTARIQHLDRVAGLNIGLTALARGEFSLVLAALAATLDPRVAPFVAGYVFVLALLAPLLATHSRTLARWPRSRVTQEA